jgi:DNA-directed RNA polymerase specialized sigma24 family protein
VVVAQIRATASLAPAQLLAWARCDDYHDPAWLGEECLVYWVRDYHRQQNRQMVSDLAAVLLHRITRHVYYRLRVLQSDDLEDCYADVVAALFAPILDLDSDRGDFAQVRFWKFLDALTLATRRQHLRARHQAECHTWPGDLAENPADGVPSAESPRALSVEQTILSHEALEGLPEPYRRTFVLRHYYGWPIEDADPQVPTISRLFGKTARTIRNWLATAEDLLEQWREEPV